MSEALKPCPFCGNDFAHMAGCDPDVLPDGDGPSPVECFNCGALGPDKKGITWNHRAPDRAAYRAGAEAMREAAQASLKARVQHWRKTAASAPTDGKRRQAMRISEETDECIDAIRALPLPGDAP